MASAKWSDSALEDLNNLDRIIQERVLAKVSWLEENFSKITPDHLHYTLRELDKLRVGDYRVVYSISGNIITIEKVRHRRDVYK